MKQIAILILSLALVVLLQASTLLVPSQYPTIQAGINAAVDGDTVLVADGVYTGTGNKNIDFFGKAIVVISENGPDNCVIDCEDDGRGFYFHTGEDTNSVLLDFKIINGFVSGTGLYDSHGGGILIIGSAPRIVNCIISDNHAAEGGGGISCDGGLIENCIISGNLVSAEYGGGGGVACGGSTIVSNCTIIYNRVLEWQTAGGGVYCGDNSLISNCTISWNHSDVGGGLFCAGNSTVSNCTIMGNFGWGAITCAMSSNITIENCIISGNNGNGVNCYSNGTVRFAGCNISYNQGHGIYGLTSAVIFDPVNRCSIYFNRHYENVGNDLYWWNSPGPEEVFLDTFTVLNPTNIQASPIANFTFDIWHEVYNPVDADLYISPEGDNANSGLTPAEPLRNIHYALNQIQADSLNPHTIYLAPGTYSSDTNGEIFPLQWLDYVSLQGSGQGISILDGNDQSSILRLWYGGDYATISHITVTNGNIPYSGDGAGIYCFAASPTIEYCTIRDNTVGQFGMGAGITCHYNASPTIRYCVLSGNTAGDWGGGMWCHNNANPIIENCVFYGNSGYWGGGIFFSTNPIIKNCIFWNNFPDQIHNVIGGAEVTYCDVMGGYMGVGNIDADPLFADSANGNFQITWANFPIPDSTKSPCIDAGDPNSPLDPDNTIADMGAFYFNQRLPIEDFNISIQGVNAVLSWTAIPIAEIYHIYRSTEPYFNISGLIPIASVIENSYINTDILTGSDYYYRITWE
jgi:hypothetical protein